MRKSYFTGYQTSKWADILTHEVFTGDEESLQYPWLCDNETGDSEAVRQKLYSIFLERSSILFQTDAITLWLKETVGFLLNQIESSEDDLVSEFIGKVASTVENPFTLDRYLHLKKSDFTDDVTTINPNELLGAGEAPHDGAGEPGMGAAGNNAEPNA